MGLLLQMIIQATQEPSHLNGKGRTFFSQLTQAPGHWFGPWNQNPFLQSSALWTKLTLLWLCSKYILTVAYFSASRQKMILKIKYFLFYRALTKYQCFFVREKIRKN